MCVSCGLRQALPLLDKAKDSFRDVTCTGLVTWGQVGEGRQGAGAHAVEGSALASAWS